ncbi:DUF7537 family lipoprotein [Halobacterium noricense]|uniref:DUF7537 family lipoprotein n=1 Tax=Halobacterium noricense TaxID=223182 RepID=UPI001E53AAB5|nr:hypothetical protein [Halobacterium noricense]UHH26665.1 hypothetical protein LT974_06970 [Halobacterium noricense]
MLNLNRSPFILIVLFVVLAGCSGQPITSGTTDVPDAATSTTTDHDTPQSTLAPGLTESGVTDAWALAQAHRDSLANTTYTERSQHTVRANGTLRRAVTTTLRQGQGDRYVYERYAHGTAALFPNLTVFRNDSTLVQRTAYDNGTVAYSGPEAAATPATDRYGNVYAVLSASPTTVEEAVAHNGTTRYRVMSTGPPTNSSAYAGVSNYTMTALVGPDGLVHEYTISYAETRGGQTVTVSTAVQFTARGKTVVQPPEWAADALVNS